MPMNRCAKFDAASFILGVEIRNLTTNKQTVNDISTPCLSACVDKKYHTEAFQVTDNSNSSICISHAQSRRDIGIHWIGRAFTNLHK